LTIFVAWNKLDASTDWCKLYDKAEELCRRRKEEEKIGNLI